MFWFLMKGGGDGYTLYDCMENGKCPMKAIMHLSKLAVTYLTSFRIIHWGSIWASPTGSKITVWKALKSVECRSPLSGQTSKLSGYPSPSISFSHASPRPSPKKKSMIFCYMYTAKHRRFAFAHFGISFPHLVSSFLLLRLFSHTVDPRYRDFGYLE